MASSRIPVKSYGIEYQVNLGQDCKRIRITDVGDDRLYS